jgi:RNA polymerase sigma-70 factor (ECF subfamily)
MSAHYDLFEQCKKGDQKAQRILYDLFKTKLMGLCRRYTRSKEEAEDVLQETFIKIFLKIHQLESTDRMESWMKSIAVRTAIDQYHKRKNQEALFQSVGDEVLLNIGLEVTLDTLSDEYLLKVINSLPDGCRMVFNLFIIEGYSHAEIAEILEVSESTSRSQLYHAKFLLRRILRNYQIEHCYERFA